MKTIFLDFDGVLFDTVKEAYLLSRYAYYNISPYTPINETEYSQFHKYRYLISKSWHFFYIFSLLNKKISDYQFEKEYKYLVNNFDKKMVEEFDKRYVNERENLMKTDYTFWDDLDEPYPFFYKIKELVKTTQNKFIILTNKKRLPVSHKLKKYELNIDLYANEDLQKYSSKGEFIDNYIRKNNIKHAILIEDSSTNIKSCSCYNIDGYLVSWGYISPKEKGLDQKQIVEKIINKDLT